MNKRPRVFVLCNPHLGTLDNWLPVIDSMNTLTSHTNFTLIILDPNVIRAFCKKNIIVKVSDNIFNTVLIQAYSNVWIEHTSVFQSMIWYQKNRIILRFIDILQYLIKKTNSFYTLEWLLSFSRNKVYKKKCRLRYESLESDISQTDILFYDIHSEGNHTVHDTLQLFKNNKKYSLPHAINMSGLEEKSPELVDVNTKNNINIYASTNFQVDYYRKKYRVNKNKIHLIGVPRHNINWIKKIQEKSPKLPDGFNNNTVIILSRHVGLISLNEKVKTLENIKKIFINKLRMKVVVKLHPKEKKERIYSGKIEKIYENVFGLNNYGSTWIYSDLHVLALGKGGKLAISLFTGVTLDVIAMGIPCVQYIDKLGKLKYNNEKIEQFVKYGLVEGISNYNDLCAYVERWTKDPNKILKASEKAYKKYFTVFNNNPKVIANEILHDNNFLD